MDKLTPWMVVLIFGTQHLERDEVPLGDVKVWTRWCKGCFDELSVSGSYLVVRGDLNFKLTKKIAEGKCNVRTNKVINAWVVRSNRAKAS